jgi:hypothetical protein
MGEVNWLEKVVVSDEALADAWELIKGHLEGVEEADVDPWVEPVLYPNLIKTPEAGKDV